VSAASDHIFVYGTLRKAIRPDVHARYLGDQAEYVGSGTVAGELWRVSWYPAMTTGDGRVFGEVYRLRDAGAWVGLDEFEACDLGRPGTSEYTREIVPVDLVGGGNVSAWCYFYLGETGSLTRIETGDFADSDCRDEHDGRE
jgi:gamma-glutamylcyclotransferase (GGCT)/AIG2-like uncharacterized protein YtfP